MTELELFTRKKSGYTRESQNLTLVTMKIRFVWKSPASHNQTCQHYLIMSTLKIEYFVS